MKQLNATVQKNGVSLVLLDNQSCVVLIEFQFFSMVRTTAHSAKGV